MKKKTLADFANFADFFESIHLFNQPNLREKYFI